MEPGIVIKKGNADSTYGGYIWVQNTETGETMQYGHMSNQAVAGVKFGQTFHPGDVIGLHATNSKEWGSSTAPHTDIRFVGVGDVELDADGADSLTSSWAYEILDGQESLCKNEEKMGTRANIQF